MARKRKTHGYVPFATQERWPVEPIVVACDYCGKPTVPMTGQQLYPHLPRLAMKGFYVCQPCDARVGTHPGTWQPLGRLANARLRRAKQLAHAAFDPLWEVNVGPGTSKRRAREAGYVWLAEQLGLNRDDCHIGMFDIAQCEAVVRLCTPVRSAA